MSAKDSVVSAECWIAGVSGLELNWSAMKGYSPRRRMVVNSGSTPTLRIPSPAGPQGWFRWGAQAACEIFGNGIGRSVIKCEASESLNEIRVNLLLPNASKSLEGVFLMQLRPSSLV